MIFRNFLISLPSVIHCSSNEFVLNQFKKKTTSRLRSDVNLFKLFWAPGLTRKTSTPCQNLMSLHVVNCQDIGSNIQIRLRVRHSPSRLNRTSLTFPLSKASTCRQEVGSKSFRPKKGMLSPSSKPANYLNICYITLCICYNGRHLEKQACSSIITVIYIRFSIFLVKYKSVVDSTAVGHNHCETLSHLSSL